MKLTYLLDGKSASFVFRILRELKETINPPEPPIDLSIGAPDAPPPRQVVEKLQQEVSRNDVHSYPSGRGEAILREAIAEWYLERFGVLLDPETEVLPVLGAKRALVDIAIAIAGSQAAVLAPTVGYPTYTIAAYLAGSPLFYYDVPISQNYAPCVEALDPDILTHAKLLYFNYPHNPTGAVLEPTDFEHLIYIAHKYGLVLCHDNAYSEITFDGFIAPSVLQFPGAKEVAIELITFSKTFNMAGWRVACVAGNADIISLIRELREDLDSGLFIPIQLAAAEALKLYFREDIRTKQSQKYERRRDVVLSALKSLGWEYFRPRGAMYVWARPPIEDAIVFTKRLYRLTGVLVVPGDAYGPAGRGWVRISLVHDCPVLEEAFSRIARLDPSVFYERATREK